MGPFDPALLGTLLLHLAAHRQDRANAALMLFEVYASMSVTFHLFAKGYLSTGTWGDR